MGTNPRPIAIYTSRGDVGAYMVYPYIYNTSGEWVGWVTADRYVYSVLGFFVGFISNDPRILRKKSTDSIHPRQNPPSCPPRIFPPATIALAPLMPEISFDTIDILMECPEQLHTTDSGNLKEDLD
jgi:hypothetical protein